MEQKEQKAIIKVLQLVLLPSSISGEASIMLSAVRNLIAKPMEHALQVYQRQDPKNQDIEPLLRALKDNVPLSRRTGGADHHELESWGNNSSTGLSGALRHTLHGLAQWSMHPSVNSMPTSYTHRQIMAARQIMGTTRALRLLLEEVRAQSEAGGASVAYDIAGALISAPDATNVPPPATHMLDAAGNMLPDVQRPQSLREALAVAAEGARKLQKKDAALAEITVRLHRRVEAQMALPQPQVMLETQGMQLDLAAAAAAAATDPMAVDGVSLDLGLGGTGSAGGLDTTSDGDLFGGLDTNMDMFNWADGTDLGGA